MPTPPERLKPDQQQSVGASDHRQPTTTTITTTITTAIRTAIPTAIRTRSVVWFVAGLLLSFGSLELAARVVGPRATARSILEQQAAGLDRIDTDVSVMFVGDSSLGADVDPVLFEELVGRDGYALWVPDAAIGVVDGLINDFAFSATTADTVVLGVTARMFNETTRPDRERLLAELTSSLPWQNRTNPSVFTTVEQWGSERLALVHYRAGLRRPTDWVVSYRSQSELTIDQRGRFNFFLDAGIDTMRDGYESGERDALRDYRVSDAEFESLAGLIAGLDDRGVEVYVAHLPLYGELYDDFFPGGEADRAAFGRRLAEELVAQPAVLVELGDLEDRPELFADGNHLNAEGAALVTQLLAAEINR